MGMKVWYPRSVGIDPLYHYFGFLSANTRVILSKIHTWKTPFIFLSHFPLSFPFIEMEIFCPLSLSIKGFFFSTQFSFFVAIPLQMVATILSIMTRSFLCHTCFPLRFPSGRQIMSLEMAETIKREKEAALSLAADGHAAALKR